MTKPPRVRWLLGLVLALGLLLAACGGGGHKTTARPAPQHRQTPPSVIAQAQAACAEHGLGHMGACVPRPKSLVPLTLTIGGRLGVDVSAYQGHPNWRAAKPHIAFAVAKAGEGSTYTDSTFAYNWHQLRALHIPHAAYYFLRPGSCTAQADRFVAIVNHSGGFDSLPPVADAEVPLPGGFVSCFIRRAASRAKFARGVVYTSPGTWAGSSHGNAHLWVATYGTRPGCVWTCTRVAWQFTGDGIGPNPHSVTGVGTNVDVNQDNGLVGLVRRPPCPHGKGTVGAPWIPRRTGCQRATTNAAVAFVRHHPAWRRHHPVYMRHHPAVARRAGAH